MTFQAFPSFARWCFFRAGDFCTVLSLTTYLSVRRWNVQGKERKYWPKIPFDYKTRPRPLVAVKSGISAVWEKKKKFIFLVWFDSGSCPENKNEKNLWLFFFKKFIYLSYRGRRPGPSMRGLTLLLWHESLRPGSRILYNKAYQGNQEGSKASESQIKIPALPIGREEGLEGRDTPRPVGNGLLCV